MKHHVTDHIPAPGEATTDRVRGIFSRIANRYDTFNALASLGIDRLWRRKLVKACGISGPEKVLDLCAGTGDVSFAIADQAHPASIMVTDFTPEMLAVAERKAADHRSSTELAFALADAQRLPFEDETYDVVTVAFGVRNLPERERNFAEVMRVLKPGGRYVILEFSRPPFAPWRGLYHLYLRYAIPAIGGILTGDRASFVYLNDSIRRFPAQTELAGELCGAGFSAVEWTNMTGGIVALHTATK